MTRSARRRLFLTTALAGTLLHGALRAADLPVPTDPATLGLLYDSTGTRLDVDLANSNRIVNWSSFDVAADHVVNFTTADTATRYSVLNRVAAGDGSDILGQITTTTFDTATGGYIANNVAVWLVNPSGITFGATGSFSGASLVLTTAAVSDADWATAIGSADPAGSLVSLTGAPVPVTDAITGVTTGAITLAAGSVITASGSVAAAAQSVSANGRISAGGEVALVAATDLALPFGVGSPLGVRIDKGTKVGKVTVAGTAQIDAAVVRLAGASTDGQAAYLLQVDDGAKLTATAVDGKVILAAGVAADGVTLGATPADVSGLASIRYDGRVAATQTGGTATLGASGDIVTTTANGTIAGTGAIGINAGGNATIGAALTSTSGDVVVGSSGATIVSAAIGGGGGYQATGASVTLGTSGTAILQQAKGAVTITATGGLLSGLDGLTLQSGSGGANAALTLSQAGTGGIVFAPATELIGGTFVAGAPAAYGYEAGVAVATIADTQPLTLGNLHARALTLPAVVPGTITAGDIVVDATLTLNAGGAIRLRSATSRSGDVALTATGDVTGPTRSAAATDGRPLTGYDRADLAALAAGSKVTVGASGAQLGTIGAGTGTGIVAGEQVTVDAEQIDVVSATAANGTLRLTSTVGAVQLGTGSAAIDAAITSAGNARIGSLTARTGNAAATATAGDVTGLALATPASDGRLVAGYGRTDLSAQGATGTIAVKANAGSAQLGTVSAGTGTAAGIGDQLAVDARAIDVISATAQNAGLRLTSTGGEVRLDSGVAGASAAVTGATNARIGSLTARIGTIAVTAGTGDATGLILSAPATDGRLVASYGRADLTTASAGQAITVTAAGGTAQLGTASAGIGAAASAGDQIAVAARAIDIAVATARNGALRLASSLGEVRLGTGSGGTDGIVRATTAARIGSLATRTGDISVTAAGGDVTGLALATPATDGRLVAGCGRADLTAQAADRTAVVSANLGAAQLGTVTAGTGTTTPAGDQIAVDARAIDVLGADARNGALRLTSMVGEVRVASGRGGTSGTVDAATDARVGDLVTRTGAIRIGARGGDATGLALAGAATDSRPDTGYGLTTLDAGTAIRVAASDDVQLATIRANTDIDIDAHPANPATATANEVAWLGGPATASAGHYRVTGGSVVLGAPGGIGQSAGADLIVRALAGDIAGGAGLALASGVGSTANQLVLYSAAGIALPSDSTLTAGTGQYADIGLAAAPGLAVTFGTATARRIGTALIDATAPTGYRIDSRLALSSPISARRIVTTADLVIDTTANGTAGDIVLDEAQSIAGGINLATTGDLRGHLLSGPPALYQRTRLTAFDGVVVHGALALLDTVTAGTGASLTAGRLDALGITANAGDLALRTSGDMRVASAIAHGNGGNGTATLLADPTIALSANAGDGTIGTAGDIRATASGDITGTATSAPGAAMPSFGRASFTASDGGITLVSDAAGAGQGLLALDNVTARGTAAGHGDVSLTGRQIDVATGVDATGGSIAVTARQLGSQTQVGATILRATAARDVTIDIGYGTAPAGTADNGSLRIGTVQAIGGNAQIAARDGSVTGLAGTTDGLDPAHARALVAAGGNVAVTAGRIVQLGELSGQDVSIAAGDDVAASVAQQGAVAHQDGAIDVAHLVSRAALTLTAAHGATLDGASGIRLGARGLGLADGGLASQVGTTATLRTLGTLGDIIVADGLTAQGDLAAAAVTNVRASALTSETGGLSLTAASGDVSGLVLPVAASDGRTIAGYGRADLATLAAAKPIAIAAAAGIAQLGTVTAGAGTTTAAGEQIAVDARAIDIVGATAQNGALRLASTVGEVRVVSGTAGTDATILAATAARIGTLATRTGSIGVTATAGDVTGLLLPATVNDGRPLPAYDRANLTAQAAGSGVAVTAAAGTAQLGPVTAGTGETTATTGGIAVAAALIDVTTATAQNAALRLTSSVGDVRLVTGTAATDATIAAATNARIGTLTTRTGSIAVAATAGDVTGLSLIPAAVDGRMVADYGRADLTAQAGSRDVTVTAARGTAQLGAVTAGTGTVTTTAGGIAVTARAIDLVTADARNAAIKLSSTVGETRLVTGTAGTDATILAANAARIGTLTTRTGAIAVTATVGDVTGLVRPAQADDGRLVAAYDRTNFTTLAAARSIMVKAAAGNVQIGTALAGTGPEPAAGEQIAVDAQAIDVTAATAQNGALRLTSTAGEARLGTGSAGTDATIQAASNARIGTLSSRTGSIAVTATTGDATGLALVPAIADGRMIAGYGRADLIAQAAAQSITVKAAAGTVQLGTVAAGAGVVPSAGDQIAVDARAIDIADAAARNGALRLTSTVGEVRLAAGAAGTDATIAARTSARIETLTTRTGSIGVTAGTGDATGLALAAPASDGRLAPAYGRADLTAQAAATTVAVTAAGTAQLGTAAAGTGATTATTGGIAVAANAIDVVSATAQNAALQLISTGGEVRLGTGTAATDATIAAATNARIGTLTTRTGSIAVTATTGDGTGLTLAPAATDGRLVPDYGRADLTAGAAGTTVTVTAAAGTAQLGAVAAGAGGTTAPGGGILVAARAIDVTTATAQNAALRLSSTAGEVRLAAGTAGTDATIAAATNARIGTLAARTGSIGVTVTAGDATGLALAPAADGRLVPAFGRADLAAPATARNVTVTAAGAAQLGTASAGAGDTTTASGGIAVAANAIDVVSATAQNAALQLTSTGGDVRLGAGTAGTDATILAANAARIGTLTTRTGSIAVTATAGDVTGLTLAPAATDGRTAPAYDRANLAAQAAGSGVTVAAAAGAAQLGAVIAGTGDSTTPGGGIAIDAALIDVTTATARNAALRLTSSVGEVRLAAGSAGTDATIRAATSARIGTLAARTGSIAIAATAGDVTGLALGSAVGDGRPAIGYGRAALTAQAAATNVTVTAAAGSAQLGGVAAGAGDGTVASGGITVAARTIDIVDADARNAALRLTSSIGETRLATGRAGTDATIRAATSARIGTLAARTGSIAVTAAAGDVTGLGLASGATDGRLLAGYGRADLAALTAARTVAVTAAAGGAQLGTVAAGTGTGTAGEQVAVDARAIDVTTATAGDGALRLASTAGETLLRTGTAATDATIRAATSARIGDLTARSGTVAVTATAGDVTGLAASGTSFDRANLTAFSATRAVTVSAVAGTAQLGTVTAGPAAATTGGGGISVAARAIDAATTNANNGALVLTATADRLYLGQGIAATTATLDKQGTAGELRISGSLAAVGNVTLASASDITLPVAPAVIGSGDTLVIRNSGAGTTSIGTVAANGGFALSEVEVNSLKAPKVMIDARANGVTIGALAIAAAAGSKEIDLLGTGGVMLTGAIANTGGGARTIQIGGATASGTPPAESVIEAKTTLARLLVADTGKGAAINWAGGTVDLRAQQIVFGDVALQNAVSGRTPGVVAVTVVAVPSSPLYTGQQSSPAQAGKAFLAASTLKVSYSDYALFQNSGPIASPTGVKLGDDLRSVEGPVRLQLFSTGDAPANSFALFGTINGFDGRTAGLLPATVIEFADLNPRVVRITQSNSRVNGCVVGSQEGCLVTNAPPTSFQLFDERQILLFGTADDAGLTFDPLIGTNNESLIGDVDSAGLGINSIDCSAPGTTDCPATGEKR